MTRYSIVPDRSQVWIDARTNVHPIHSSTSGLEGYVELDLEPSGTIDPAGTPDGTALPGCRPPQVGQPHGGPGAAEAH